MTGVISCLAFVWIALAGVSSSFAWRPPVADRLRGHTSGVR
jgi:hypothetical protein